MEVQTVEKKPNTGKQTVTATEETSSVAERTKEVNHYKIYYKIIPCLTVVLAIRF